jgi:hypothetical protein
MIVYVQFRLPLQDIILKLDPIQKGLKKITCKLHTKLIELKLQCIYDRSFDCPLKSLLYKIY